MSARARVVTVGETMALLRSGTIGSLAHLPSVEDRKSVV